MDQDAPTRAAAYLRVSQERAARNGFGLEAQEDKVTRFVEYKGLDLVEVFREEGVSGYKRDRPALDRLLEGARAGRFSTVIFPSIDRAGRSVKDVIEIDQALREAGVTTVYIREGVDTSTATGQLFRNILASIAEFEGRVICERLHGGRRRKMARGGYGGGWLPYGYQRGESGVEIVPDQADIVRRIFAWHEDGRALQWIADCLNEEGIPSRTGGIWHASTIRGMLRNAYYRGEVEHDGEVIPGLHEAILQE